MTKLLLYKGFHGSAELDLDEYYLYGKILFIEDVVTYEGATIEDLKAAFEEAVEDYLATCAEIGKEPNKPFSGSFNIRVGPEIHKRAAIQSRLQGVSLNEFVCSAIDEKISRDSQPLNMIDNHVFRAEAPARERTYSVTTEMEMTATGGEYPWEPSIQTSRSH